MNKLLQIKNLNVELYAKNQTLNTVSNVTIDIAQNEIVCLVGESGSGKTVTSMAIMRLIDFEGGAISSGEILFENRNLAKLSQQEMRSIRGNKIAMIFQDATNALDPLFPIGDQIIDVILQHKEVTKKKAYAISLDLLRRVKIADPEVRMQQYPHEFSGGMLQRIMIAIALACEPKLLIADEPTTALDVTIQAQILALLKELRDELGMALLFITHDLGVTAEIADRVVVMYAGKIVEQGDVQTIFQSPRHPYTLGLIQSVSAYESKNELLYTIKGSMPALTDFPKGCRFAARCDFATDVCRREEPSEQQEKYGSFSCWNPISDEIIRVKNTENSELIDVTSRKPLLEARNVKKYFTMNKNSLKQKTSFVKAVDDISFTLYEGETFGLVGESGSGKTTLGRLLLQLEKPTDGEVLFEGENLFKANRKDLQKIKRNMQIVFQDPSGSMNPRWTLEKIIEEPLKVHTNLTRRERFIYIKETLELVGLNPAWVTKYPHELSGGQKQRVSIARAIILKPKFILLDEAVSALDVSIQSQIINLLKNLQKELNITFLFIAHGLNTVRFLSDRVGVMYLGKLVEVGTAKEIFENPLHPYTKALIDANPIADPNVINEFVPLVGEVPSPTNLPTGCRFHTRCTFATDRCKSEEPVLQQASENQTVACHFPLIKKDREELRWDQNKLN